MTSKKIDPEYQEFLDDSAHQPSGALQEQILSVVHRDLNPTPVSVFSKLLGIHFVTSLVTLSICPQFGFRILGEGMGLMQVFMNFGETGCLIACGAFFMGLSLLIAGSVLRGEELRIIRKNRWLTLGALTLLSLGFFIMLDAQIVLNLSIAWFLGALFGSLGILELTWLLRFKARSTVQ